MRTLIFRCPSTGQKVQGWISDDGSEPDDADYEAISCVACKSVHLVNQVSGKTLGTSDD
jgi:hypothetical protein